MKKILVALLILALCAAAALAEPVSGGWQNVPHEAAELPEDAQAAFDQALEGLVGANYVPVALLSTQLVAGMNYCVLCQITPVVPDAEPSWALVYIYADLDGNAEITNVYELYVDRHSAPSDDAPLDEAGTLYTGIDPWGNPLSVTLTDADALSGVWSENFYGDLFVQAFEDARDGFALEGPLSESDYNTCRYAGTMALDGDALTVTFTDGEMTTDSTEGGSTSYHVAALDDEQRTVTLAPVAQSDYSGVTTLDAAAVEAFAAQVRQLYLDADWDGMAQLIDYPITLYPDVVIEDADAFAAFMADKAVDDADLEAMAAESCVGMMSNGEGICMGSGEVWLRDVGFDGIEQTGEPDLRVIALSGLSD